MAKSDEPQFTLTASGQQIALPKPIAGNPLCLASQRGQAEEARAQIQRGNLAEALIWIERSSPLFDGIVALSERRA